jgi:precorrin-6A synthase
MKKVFVIGIGAGNPDYVTIQAINALNEVDVFFIMDKGQEKEELVRVRKEICERYIKDKSYLRGGDSRPAAGPRGFSL